MADLGRRSTARWVGQPDNFAAVPIPEKPDALPDGVRPGPACPARHGAGADVNVAHFVLVVDDCENGPCREPTSTDIFGYFRLPGDEHDDDSVITAGLFVPISSPIARLAHQVGADPHGPL